MKSIIYFLLLGCSEKTKIDNLTTEPEKMLIEDNKQLNKLKSETIHNGNENVYAWLIDYLLQ